MTVLRVVFALIAFAGIGWLVKWDIGDPEVSFAVSLFCSTNPFHGGPFLAGVSHQIPVRRVGFIFRGRQWQRLGRCGNSFLPARLGDFGKPSYFNAMCGFPVSKGLVLVVEERIWDFVGLAILAILTLFLLGEQANSPALLTASYLTMSIAVLGLFCLVVLPRVITRLPILSRLEEKYGLFSVRSPQHLFTLLIISLLIWAASLNILVVAYRFSGLPELHFAQLLFLFVASTLGLVIFVTPGSIGTYEGAIVAVLVGYDVSWDSALAFAIGFRLTWLALPLAVAAWAVLTDAKLLGLLQRNKGT